jgi:hypothetical protein
MVKKAASVMLQIGTLLCLMHLTATAQQPPNSDQSDNLTADRAYDADVQLMRQDLRASMKQAAPAARITKNGGFLFATCESLGHLQIGGVI